MCPAAPSAGTGRDHLTDEYGTDPTLRYRETSLHINALTMLSKRIEDGEVIDVRAMAKWLANFVAEKGRTVD